MSVAGEINGRPPSAFWISATMHGLLLAVLFCMFYSWPEDDSKKPKIFELVAGADDNFGALEAPALGSPTGVKFDVPEAPVAPPSPAPTPEPEPSPITPAPPEPVPPTPVAPAPTPVKPTEVVKPKPVPKPVDMAKLVTRITQKRADNIKKKIEKDQKVAEDRAAKEAALDAKRMTKAEFDRMNKGSASKVSKIDAEGIASGVTGGSTNNKTGGAGGKALTREQMELSDAYIAMLIQRLRQAHQKPDGLSDLLQTKVSFRLNSDGSVSDVRIVHSSGNNDYDNSVLAAFRKVRLPTPPANLKTDTYSVTFKMKEDE